MDIHQERLIRRAASGDDSAFEQLMLAQQKQVYNLCLRMSGNPEDAFDLSQEAFLRAWRALAQYQFEAEFSTWLFRLTRNVCIDFLRKQKRQPTVPLETEQGGETLADTPCLRLTLDTTAPGGNKVLCAVWLDAEGLFPRYAEFSQNEQVVLTAKLLDFTCTTSEG